MRFLVVLALSTAVPAEAATLTPKTQNRVVQIALTLGGTPQSSSAKAAGFGIFDKTLNIGGGAGFEPYQVQAVQHSEITGSAITANGSSTTVLANGLVSEGSAQSDFQVSFRIVQPVTYTLNGSVGWDEIYPDPGAVSPNVKLSGATGPIYEATTQSDGLPTDYITTGTLQPGDYTIEAHAGAAYAYAGAGSTKTFSLSLSLSPVGPPQPGPGQVYSVNGLLTGLRKSGGAFSPVTIRSADLVNLALAKPAGYQPRNEVLALVSDRLNQSVRLVIWDSKAQAVLAELCPVVLTGGMKSSAAFAQMADLPIRNVGKLLETLDGVSSLLTLAAKGTYEPADGITVNKLSSVSLVGQLNFTDGAGAADSILITRGTLLSGRKLGTTP